MHLRSPSLVGRSGETAILHNGLAAARDRAGQAVFLRAEAGLGKSRLAAWCAEQATASGMPVLRGRTSSTTVPMPFRPITEALLTLFRTAGPPDNPGLAPYRPVLARLIPEWRSGQEAPAGPGTLLETAEAVLRLVGVAGAESGCLLSIEDLHDAEPETLAIVEYLADHIASLPVLLLVTLRPEHSPALDLTGALERRGAARVADLGPLSPEDVRALGAACLGVGPGGLPEPVAAELARYGGGSPFVVEELLRDMVSRGALHPSATGWRVSGDLSAGVPMTVVRAVTERAERLGQQTRAVLDAAAVLGQRFRVADLEAVAGHAVGAQLRAAAGAQLIRRAAEGEYEFCHALTAEALRESLPQAAKAGIARSASAILESQVLSADRCQQIAGLRLTAGDPAGAAGFLTRAGLSTLESGAVGSAVALLDRACELAGSAGAAGQEQQAREALLRALLDAGQIDRALSLAGSLPQLGTEQRAALHLRLAIEASGAGRMADAAEQLRQAKHQIPDPGREQAAAIALLEGRFLLGSQPEAAEALLRRAAADGAPDIACRAWQLLASSARRDGFTEADACLREMLAIAERHTLPLHRLRALLGLGINEFLCTGDANRLHEARRAMHTTGDIGLAHFTESAAAMQAALTGHHAEAGLLLDNCTDALRRLRDTGSHSYALAIRALVAAHQGDRQRMTAALLAFDQAAGPASPYMPIRYGLASAFCALLEEDGDRAWSDLEELVAWQARHNSPFQLGGRHGLYPLLGVLRGQIDAARFAQVSAEPAAQLRWNKQFVLYGQAVLSGRSGHADHASRLVAEAQAAGQVFPLARNLGLRLVAEAGIDGGWGEPVAWLGTAEEHFHTAGLTVAARACRRLTRRAGGRVPQRRAGESDLPAALRELRISVREYEVLRLMATGRHSNRDIAGQLFISPRTAEKHVASLIAKTGAADRAGLCAYAATLPG
ncbi:ATP-binding protein [Longispora albida]|uniref:ATP-binding protein n=1 Tax=Longispora albida TaxID=203523 RepID=UPI00036567DB|nr:LuxR family transcriptional regulator [Longispora albida]